MENVTFRLEATEDVMFRAGSDRKCHVWQYTAETKQKEVSENLILNKEINKRDI